MKKQHTTIGTVVEVLKEHWPEDKNQYFHLVNDNGNKSLWAVKNQKPIRIGHRVKLSTRENRWPQFALIKSECPTRVQHDRSSIHHWFEGPTARDLLAGILKDPTDRLPRRVLGDHLANDQPFDSAKALGLAILRSLDEQGTFFLPLDKRLGLAPFTCAYNGILYGRDPLKTDSETAQSWLGMTKVFGDPIRGERPKRKDKGTFIQCYADLWQWVQKEVGDFQTTNEVAYSIIEAEDRPPFRTDWAEFLSRQNIREQIISMGSIISYPPPGFHTKLDTRSAAAYLDIPIAELRRLNRTGTILGERSLLRILFPELLSADKTGDKYFEQVDLEDYVEKRWVVAE